MKKGLSIVIAIILMLSCLSAFSACQKSGGENYFRYFLYKGIIKYDESYKRNAGVQWLENMEFAGVHIDLDMMVPPRSSSAQETMQTMISSGDYPEIIQTNALTADSSIYELYKDGIIMDLTPYVTQYMPTYLKYIEDNPDIAEAAYTDVDGEKRFLTLQIFTDAPDPSPWMYMYRRDWIVKYGANPVTGERFTGGYDENDEWNDNVIFPNGTNLPIYLSDWMWMFDIFKTAITDLGLQEDLNSYCISIPFAGNEIMGGLCGAFNVNLDFYIANDGEIKYGGLSDNAKTYYAAMNDWYQKGYLDKTFYERSSDAPYNINPSSLSAGKIGMSYMQRAFLASTIRDESEPLLKDAYLMAARLPINDVYGKGTSACYDAETNDFHNNWCYANSKVDAAGIVISANAADKNLEALFSMLDYMYTDEWAIIHNFGLNKEQQEVIQNELYIEFGIDEAYTYALDEDGNNILNQFGEKMLEINPVVSVDDNKENSVKGNDIFGKNKRSLKYTRRNSWDQFSFNEVTNYEGCGWIQDDLKARLPSEISMLYKNIATHLRTEAETITYKYVTGELDPFNANDWKVWDSIFDREYRNSGKTVRESVESVLVAFNKVA